MAYLSKMTEMKWGEYPVYVRDGRGDQDVCNEVMGSDCYGLRGFTTTPQTILDVGSHIGTFICHAKSIWPEATIYGFEPLLENYRMLQINTCFFTGVHIYNTALVPVEAPTTGRLNIWTGNSGGNSLIWGDPATNQSEPCTVTNPKDYDLPPHFDLVKFDCEGCETLLLPYLTQNYDIPLIVGEYHGAEAANMLDTLLPNYTVVRAPGTGIALFTAVKK